MILPDRCPLCGENWEPYDPSLASDLVLYAECKCPQYDECGCQITKEIKSVDENSWLHRIIGRYDVWWDVVYGIDYRYDDEPIIKVDFDLPFDVDEERLRLLLAFS